MNEKTTREDTEAVHSDLRNQVRALKARGFTYLEAGKKVLNNGKPIGAAMAKWYAHRLGHECKGCLRPLVKK